MGAAESGGNSLWVHMNDPFHVTIACHLTHCVCGNIVLASFGVLLHFRFCFSKEYLLFLTNGLHLQQSQSICFEASLCIF